MIAWLQSYEVYHHKIYQHRNVLKLIIVCGKYTYKRVVGAQWTLSTPKMMIQITTSGP